LNGKFANLIGPRGVLDCKASDVYDENLMPGDALGRFGPLGYQTCEDTGPLNIERMKTVDREFLNRTKKLIAKATVNNQPFFTWFNSTRMHFYTHISDDVEGISGQGFYSVPDKLELKLPSTFGIENTPNILVVMLDDVGYGQFDTFGSPIIQTPTMDEVADNGLRYTQFHTTALCSPTRAALLTARNHHSVAIGALTNGSTGYPGYNSIIPQSAEASPKSFRLMVMAPPGLAKTITFRNGKPRKLDPLNIGL